MRTALGFAGTQAAGLNTFFETGDDTKSLHPGKAGLNGVLAARLAALGAPSPPTILEHPKGYLAAYSAEPKPSLPTDGLGSRWEILENGFKFYPSILASHSPIGATLELVGRHAIAPERIRRITNHTYGTVKSHFSSKAVETSMAARLSVPYCVAVAAVDRELTQRQFRPERFRDALVRRVLDRTEIVADPELDALYPEKFPARVVIEMEDGQRFEASVMHPIRRPAQPPRRSRARREVLRQRLRARRRRGSAGAGSVQHLTGLCLRLQPSSGGPACGGEVAGMGRGARDGGARMEGCWTFRSSREDASVGAASASGRAHRTAPHLERATFRSPPMQSRHPSAGSAPARAT